MSGEALAVISQFGPAGLMGLLWILERRHAAIRDRQLSEAHRALAALDSDAAALLNVVRDNTRAIVTLEQTQRHLLRLADRLNERLAIAPRGGAIAGVRTRVGAGAAAPGADAA